MPENSPEAEVAIDAGLVRSLLREQHPDLHALPLERFATGWDNELWALGEFVATLRGPAPLDVPHNPWRGVPLAARDARLRAAVRALEPNDTDGITAAAVLAALGDAVGAPTWSGPPQWLHGDLHLANLLVDHGRLVAVVDWGDVTAGDPATDLGVAWMAFGPEETVAFREAADADDDALWRRGRGRPLAIGLALLVGSADVPAMEQMGRRTVLAVLADA